MPSVIRGDDNFDTSSVYEQPTGVGEVGTYAFLRNTGAASAGQTYSGSVLYYTNAYGDAQGAAIGVGTWRCMGNSGFTTAGEQLATLYLRIS